MADRGDRVDPVEAIVDVGRRTRNRTSRGLWIAAALLGAACLVGFVLIFVAEPEPAAPIAASELDRSGTGSRGGFWSGLGVGAGIGIAVGYVLARRSRGHSSGAPDHSSRRSP